MTDILRLFLKHGPEPHSPRALSLFGGSIHDGGLRALAASPFLASVETLDLTADHVTPTGLEALASSPHLTSLQTLFLGSNALDDAGLAILASAPAFASLRYLDLSQNRITDLGMASLAASTTLTSLRFLSLGMNRFTDAGVQSLAMSPILASVEELVFSHASTPTGPGYFRFTSYPDLTYPSRGDLTNASLQALASSPFLASLRVLWLSFQKINSAGFRALASSEGFPSLQTLYLRGSDLEPTAIHLLLLSPFFASFQSDRLFLEHNSHPFCDPVQNKRALIQNEPLRAWLEETDPAWRLLAYALLPADLQAGYHPAFLEIAATFASEPSGLAWSWCQKRMLGFWGTPLEAAARCFPTFEALQGKWQQEKARMTALEGALFSGGM